MVMRASWTLSGSRVAGGLGGGASGRVLRRRRIDRVLLGFAVVAVALVALGAAMIGNPERVAGAWLGAEVGEEGSAQITEVIDWDFGYRQRHGIFRDVPGLAVQAPVQVTSATAPALTELTAVQGGTRIRVGDPARTVGGRHRYRIGYPLDGVAVGGRLAWDAVGTEFDVTLRNIEIHVVTPYELTAVGCARGGSGSQQPCEVSQPEPGHLVVRIDRLPAHGGVTMYATAGRRLESAPRLQPPGAGPAAGGRPGWAPPVLLAAVLALAAVAVMSWLIRRAGRERVAGAVGMLAVRSGSDGTVRLDTGELTALAGLEFRPPDGLSPAQGGVLLAEAVRTEHKVAWLVDAAVSGHLRIDENGSRTAVLLRQAKLVDSAADAATAAVLDRAFAGRQRLELGGYDREFAGAWGELGRELKDWQRHSGLWDAAGDRRVLLARVFGAIAAVSGLGLVLIGGAITVEGTSLPLVGAGAAAAGGGLAALVRGWELRVRTAVGSALWLRTEGFRRYLAQADGGQVDQVAGHGQLSRYAAWAMALGEGDQWARALATATVTDPYARHYSSLGPTLYGATAAAATAPSSSSSGSSGSSGGVGGGAGGGGGGSW